jgi:hypothetical protein
MKRRASGRLRKIHREAPLRMSSGAGVMPNIVRRHNQRSKLICLPCLARGRRKNDLNSKHRAGATSIDRHVADDNVINETKTRSPQRACVKKGLKIFPSPRAECRCRCHGPDCSIAEICWSRRRGWVITIATSTLLPQKPLEIRSAPVISWEAVSRRPDKDAQGSYIARPAPVMQG